MIKIILIYILVGNIVSSIANILAYHTIEKVISIEINKGDGYTEQDRKLMRVLSFVWLALTWPITLVLVLFDIIVNIIF